MDKDQRKAAIAAYKERKPAVGIYALRCCATGQVWVDQTLTLDTIRNRLWFSLRQGRRPLPGLQQAWSAHGGDSFAFEELERLPEDVPPYARDSLLAQRRDYWRAK